MDKNRETLVSTNTECAPHQVVPNCMGHLKMSNTGSDHSHSPLTKPAEIVYNTTNRSLPVFILTPVNTNIVQSQFISPNVLCNTSSALTHILTPYQIKNSAGTQTLNYVSPVSDADPKGAAVQQNVLNVTHRSAFKVVTVMFQNITSQIPLENTEPEYSEIQKTIHDISLVVEQIFATSSEGVLITFPCTPGFEKEKVGPVHRTIVKRGSRVSLGLCDECELEKKFNIIFQYMSADFFSYLSTESGIKRIICYAMNVLMDVMPVEYALTLVCNCSLCWFLYMCAKVIYRDSPEGMCKLNWSGCPISSYKCLAMRKIAITDMKSEAGVGEDTSAGCHSILQIRFTRGGQKRKPYRQSEQLKSVKHSIFTLVPDLSKSSEVIVRPCDNADVKKIIILPNLGLNKASKVTGRTHDRSDVPSCSFNTVKPSQSKKDTQLKFGGQPRSWTPEDDLLVFNPVRQFKGNTYTRRKNCVR